jgi:hypothetical protein
MKNQKEIKIISDIENEFKKSNRIALYSLIVVGIVVCVSIFFYTNLVKNVVKNKMVFVATPLGNEYLSDRNSQIIAHLENFHKLFFQIDEFNFKRSIEKSYYLIDRDLGKKLKDNYAANDWYKNIQSLNLSIGIETDSIIINGIDNTNNKYYLTFYGKQLIRSKSEIVVRNLITKSEIKNVSNDINNPFGCQIEEFQIVNNSDIERRNIKGELIKSLTETE